MRCTSLALAMAGVLLLGGCASAPRDRGTREIDRLLAERGAPAAGWTMAAEPAPTGVLSLAQSVNLAFVRSPVVREQYAELGVATADLR